MWKFRCDFFPNLSPKSWQTWGLFFSCLASTWRLTLYWFQTILTKGSLDFITFMECFDMMFQSSLHNITFITLLAFVQSISIQIMHFLVLFSKKNAIWSLSKCSNLNSESQRLHLYNFVYHGWKLYAHLASFGLKILHHSRSKYVFFFCEWIPPGFTRHLGVHVSIYKVYINTLASFSPREYIWCDYSQMIITQLDSLEQILKIWGILPEELPFCIPE